MAEEKKYVKERVEGVSRYSFEGPVIDVISKLKKLLKAGEARGYSNIELEYDWYDKDYDLKGERLETDKEFERRLKRRESARKAAETKKADKEVKEKKLYDRLKEKYGGSE